MNTPRSTSRSAASPARQLKGQPTGGQFAAKANPECETELGTDQPVCTVLPDGTQEWRLYGKRHRADGPAVISPDGYEAWYLNGRLHRADGPAITYPDGAEEWWLDGKLHRTDGPAIVDPDGSEAWYQHGKWWKNGERIHQPTDSPLSIES